MKQTEMNDEQLQQEFQKNLPRVDAQQGWRRLQARLADQRSPGLRRFKQRRPRVTITAVTVGAAAIVIILVAATVLGVFGDGTEVASVDVTTGSTGGGPATVTTTSPGPVRPTTDGPSGAGSVLTTSPWADSWPSVGASEAAKSAISAWPAGIEFLVLSTGYEVYVVDHDGIRWSQEMQARPEDTSLAPSTPFDGVAVSKNQQFLAYVDHAKEVVVRSISDGAEVGRVPYRAESETQLRCLSSDGNLVALASVSPDLPKGTVGSRLPWKVIILNLHTGETSIEQPLEDLVKERTATNSKAAFTLYSLHWLSEGRLLVQYSGSGQTAYVYDIQTDSMVPIPGLSMVSAVGDDDTVYGWGDDPKGPRPVIWDGGAIKALELDADSAYAGSGAFNQAGDALVVQVLSSTHQARGWQLYRLTEGHWERSGPVSEISWMKAGPRVLSADGTSAYTALEGGRQWESGQYAALLSHDFQTGAWQEWLGPEDLLVDFGQYPFVAIVPTAAPIGG